MRKRLIIGWVVFILGILLQEVSDIVEIWIVGVLGGILWPVGMVMGINASIALKHEKQCSDSSGHAEEQEKN